MGVPLRCLLPSPPLYKGCGSLGGPPFVLKPLLAFAGAAAVSIFVGMPLTSFRDGFSGKFGFPLNLWDRGESEKARITLSP